MRLRGTENERDERGRLNGGVDDNLASVCAHVSVRLGNKECVWRESLTESEQFNALWYLGWFFKNKKASMREEEKAENVSRL